MLDDVIATFVFFTIWITYIGMIFVYFWCLGAMAWVMFDTAYFKDYEARQIIRDREKLKGSFRLIQGGKDVSAKTIIR